MDEFQLDVFLKKLLYFPQELSPELVMISICRKLESVITVLSSDFTKYWISSSNRKYVHIDKDTKWFALSPCCKNSFLLKSGKELHNLYSLLSVETKITFRRIYQL